MNVTKQEYKGRKFHKENCPQKVAAEQRGYAGVPAPVRIVELNDINLCRKNYIQHNPVHRKETVSQSESRKDQCGSYYKGEVPGLRLLPLQRGMPVQGT